MNQPVSLSARIAAIAFVSGVGAECTTWLDAVRK
jgi:hypothetical protein